MVRRAGPPDRPCRRVGQDRLGPEAVYRLLASPHKSWRRSHNGRLSAASPDDYMFGVGVAPGVSGLVRKNRGPAR